MDKRNFRTEWQHRFRVSEQVGFEKALRKTVEWYTFWASSVAYENLLVRDSYSCQGALVRLNKEDAYIH